MTSRILLVEDDLNLGYLLSEFLEDRGYTTKLCRTSADALQQLERQRFDLGILDVMLPQMDGFSLARTLRHKGWLLPILFLTAKTRKEDQLRGYRCGAEDYVTKPFDEEVLACKIAAILRRAGSRELSPPERQQYLLGDYRFYPDLQALTFRDQASTRLTEKESQVLEILCRYRNRILKRSEALHAIYGKDDYFLGRSFDVFISRLRKRLRHDERVGIENIYKVGFMLRTPEP